MSNVCKKRQCAVLFLAILLSACDNYQGDNTLYTPPTKTEIQFELSEGRKALTATNLSSTNNSLIFEFGYRPDRVAAAQPQFAPLRFAALQSSVAPLMDMEAASRFNANPPLVREPPSRAVESPRFNTYIPGSEKSFYVTNKEGTFVTITAVLQKQGAYCNIWVDKNCFAPVHDPGRKKIIADDAAALANKFDEIYPLATNLLGFEYGGGPGGDGGRDGDLCVQILVYDIAEKDVIGYFWGKDEYTQSYWDLWGNGKTKSNEAEIFYIDAGSVRSYPELINSTLVHEFQHMINYNRKTMRRNLASGTWYDEMLAMLAEDVISPLIGIGPKSGAHPIDLRIPIFLGVYPECGVDQWLDKEVGISYSNTYAFGAYLIRNYGGPELVKAMLDNNFVNHDSVTDALRTVNGDDSLDFDTALIHYAEAFLYSSTTNPDLADKMTFDRSITSLINGISYKAEAFDIWAMQMSADLLRQYVNKKYLPDMNYKGPVIFPLFRSYQIPGHSVWLHRIEEDRTGNLAVTFSSYANIILDMVSY